MIGGCESGKTDALINLISHHTDIDKIYLYAKNPYLKECQMLVNKREGVGLNHYNDCKVFTRCSIDMDDI